MYTTYRISTLGCKVNQQESETLAASFEALGFLPVRNGEAADVYVINSCTVTSMADSKTRQRISQARAANAGGLVCVVGCLPETSREAVLAMPEVDIVIGSLEKERTAEIVLEAIKTNDTNATGPAIFSDLHCESPESQNTFLTKSLAGHRQSADGAGQRANQRTRAFIKVEDGCDRYCAYCIVPYARGPVRSRPSEDVLTEAEGLLAAGYKELVLTGVNLAMYGRDNDKGGTTQQEPSPLCSQRVPSPLCSLVERICAIAADGEHRVRLGSLEPTVISAEETSRIAGIKGVCPQFHLSLQSGARKTLEEMGRPYTPEDYAEIVEALRRVDPLFSITTDVIVGFPGERGEDFEESLAFVKNIGFAGVHVFKYSKRPGTRAALMPSQIPEAVKNERSRRMLDAAEGGAARFAALNKGVSRRTLIFGPDKSGRFIRGLTDNGVDVLLPRNAGDYVPNSFIDVTL